MPKGVFEHHPLVQPGVSTVRRMRATEAAWVGAMIEAEGHVEDPRPTDRHRRPRTRMSVSNTDVEIVATLLRLVGDGRVRMDTPRKTSRPRQTVWIWSLARRQAVIDLAPQIAPYMTAKGDRLRSLIASF